MTILAFEFAFLWCYSASICLLRLIRLDLADWAGASPPILDHDGLSKFDEMIILPHVLVGLIVSTNGNMIDL